MTQVLQTLQVALFALPTLTLMVIGIVILRRSVSIVDRRWFLAVLIPLLLANTLSIAAENGQLRLDWRTWLILAADVILISGAVWLSRGFQVYGLDLRQVEHILTDSLHTQGFSVSASSAEKQDLWGRTKNARLLTAVKAEQTHLFWVTSRFNEVLVLPERSPDANLFRRVLPALRAAQVPYDFKAHAVGVLYIVLALVFAVLSWIFFFEPRFILIE